MPSFRSRRVTLKGVTFYELAGDGARVELERLAGELQKAGMTTELLESTTQAGLFLLVCRGVKSSADTSAVTFPEGLRVWQFRQAD